MTLTSFPNVRRYWAEILGVSEAEIQPDTRLRADATSIAKLIIRCERAFRIEMMDEDVLDFATVGALSDHIDERLADGIDDYAQPTDKAREAWYYE